MWYKIDNINHDKFTSYFNFENTYGCNIIREDRNKFTISMWDKAFKKPNPPEIYYFDNGIFQIFEIIKLHNEAWNIIGYSIKWDFTNKSIDPTQSYHFIAQWLVDIFNTKEVKKVKISSILKKDFELDSEADLYMKEVKENWGDYWIVDGDVDIKIYESYGIKVSVLEEENKIETTYELM